MPTHTDNRHYGTFVEGPVNIGTLNNSEGANPESILSFLPTHHDLSDQANGITMEFNLNPIVKAGTQNLTALYIDGVLQSKEDYSILPARNKIVLNQSIGPVPTAGTNIIFWYVEETSEIN